MYAKANMGHPSRGEGLVRACGVSRVARTLQETGLAKTPKPEVILLIYSQAKVLP